LPARFGGMSIDCWKITQDHVHVLLALNDCRATVSEIAQAFKSLSTRAVKQTGVIGRVWQRGFHDRIVRREKDLEGLREYIRNDEAVHAKRRK
jgi:putative transposase